MFNLSPRVWVLNAAAVFSGKHGAVTQQAEQAGCCRETVYQHARKVEQRLTGDSAAEGVVARSEENQRLREHRSPSCNARPKPGSFSTGLNSVS
ncbi:hypothetical protein [Singulisphaera acidiphila]|uniref:Uncharacterized protein n=1 Tax=Singulisphaera acidiphila (strain ATCC BAA-1392 / DSM 18658 / VKM B-2454 / MOB10) TaxID=886293 RepID=L0DDR9_SINAD|nr:hypothetical protein [Singulisphaera acidiphila]AGA27524.1 hypothetical protein Sinac_3253 [Singulisphaera acidiphila DSM 18658]